MDNIAYALKAGTDMKVCVQSTILVFKHVTWQCDKNYHGYGTPQDQSGGSTDPFHGGLRSCLPQICATQPLQQHAISKYNPSWLYQVVWSRSVFCSFLQYERSWWLTEILRLQQQVYECRYSVRWVLLPLSPLYAILYTIATWLPHTCC